MNIYSKDEIDGLLRGGLLRTRVVLEDGTNDVLLIEVSRVADGSLMDRRFRGKLIESSFIDDPLPELTRTEK